MARMNPLKKYAVGMATIAAVSGGIGMAQTWIAHGPVSNTPVAQVQPSTPVTQSPVGDAVDTAQVADEPVRIEQQVDVQPAVDSTVAPSAKLQARDEPVRNVELEQPDQGVADDTYVESAESEDEYVWVDERHDRDDEHEYEYHEDDEGGGYDE